MGKHSKPNKPSRVGKISTVGILTVGTTLSIPSVASADPPGGWGAIIECESGGDPTIENPSPNSTASGLFQFTNETWRSVGGVGRAKDASVAEQYRRAELLYQRRGTQPWNASRSCWSGRTVADTSQPSAPSPPPPPETDSNSTSTSERTPTAIEIVDTRNEDGTGSYTCVESKLYFEACDAHNLGEVVNYPAYKGKHRVSVSTEVEVKAEAKTYTVVSGDTLQEIAASNGTKWQIIYKHNKSNLISGDADLIYPGEVLELG